MPKLEVTLTVDKVTKNSIRYRETPYPENPEGPPEDHPIFPVIYIRKDALVQLGSSHPDTIKVTVEVV